MTNETKTVKQVFKDLDTRSNILECEIKNVSLFKKSNKIVIDLKSKNKIQFGEKMEFEYYLKSKFKVADAQINIEEEISEKKSTKGKKEEKADEEETEMIVRKQKSQNIK